MWKASAKSGWGSRNLGVRLLFRHVPTKFQDLTFGFALFPGLPVSTTETLRFWLTEPK